MDLRSQLRQELLGTLRRHRIEVAEPCAGALELRGVCAGADYSKPCTNVLLRQYDESNWEVFVDEDFYYVGEDRLRRRRFCGWQAARWSQLQLPTPLTGDVNEAIVRGLRLIDSPIAGEVPALGTAADNPSGPGLSALPAPPKPPPKPPPEPPPRPPLVRPDGRPQPSQAELARRAAEIVARRAAPAGAVLIGPAGSGRTSLAAWAAARLVRQQVVERVVEVSGAALQCGTLLLPQRDQRLQAALDELVREPRSLLIVEQLELACGRSPVAAALLADALERGLRLIATAAPGLRRSLLEPARLWRRLEPLRIQPLATAELRALLTERLRRHPLVGDREIAPELIPVIMLRSRQRPGANPGAAVALLDAALTHAAHTAARCVGPDDVYHVLRQFPA